MFEKGESVKTELETAEVLNKVFFNFVNNLEILNYSKYKSFIDNIVFNRYLLISILPVLSKLYERRMFNQISEFFENVSSKNQCGSRKGYRTQQCLIAALEKWKKSVNSGKVFGALLTDLFKLFDCFDHEL